MTIDPFDREKAILENEFAKEERRHVREDRVFVFIGIVMMLCVFALAFPVTTKQSADGKSTTVCGADDYTKSWARTTITVIMGAAIGYALKQTPKPPGSSTPSA